MTVQVLCIRKPEEPIDLFMVEIMHMRHKFDVDTRLVRYCDILGLFRSSQLNVEFVLCKSFVQTL